LLGLFGCLCLCVWGVCGGGVVCGGVCGCVGVCVGGVVCVCVWMYFRHNNSGALSTICLFVSKRGSITDEKY